MKETFNELVAYLKNPVLEEDTNTYINYRITKFGHLLIISLLTGLATSVLIGALDEFGLVNMDDHQMEEMMKSLSKTMIFVMAVVIAPLLEEVIFRAPLVSFKKGKQFRIGFYTFAILFGLVHITNYNLTTNVLLFAPILVLPQLLLGGYLGFIRVRFGLLWSILLHAAYNGILMGGALIFGFE